MEIIDKAIHNMERHIKANAMESALERALTFIADMSEDLERRDMPQMAEQCRIAIVRCNCVLKESGCKLHPIPVTSRNEQQSRIIPS